MTTLLVHLNGAPAVGKSTLARALVEERRMALLLDIDVLRMSLGQWATNDESKGVARRLGLELAAAHLRGGHDVVLPQLVVEPTVVTQLDELATEAGARYVEVLLVADDAVIAQRFAQRTGPHPAALTGRVPYAPAPRPTTAVVDVSGALDESLSALRAALDG